jgi:hypothetical protein
VCRVIDSRNLIFIAEDFLVPKSVFDLTVNIGFRETDQSTQNYL